MISYFYLKGITRKKDKFLCTVENGGYKMIIGVPKELKNNENRVALTPAGVLTFVKAGHSVIVEKGAGEGSGFTDEEYEKAGATLERDPASVWKQAEMILKVKEPIPEEYPYLRPGLIVFAFLHLAAEKELGEVLCEKKVTAIAYETVEKNGRLPLLTPMSEVAGRMAPQIGTQFLEKTKGGKGVLLSGIPGVERGKVTIIGAGVVGTHAAKAAMGMGAEVTILDINLDRLREIDDMFGKDIQTLYSNSFHVEQAVKRSDLVIGAVLIPGARAPRLVTEEMIKQMDPGSVVIDVAIDQGGVIETCDRVTSHDDPTYVKHGVIHYAVANIPGAVPRTATIGLTNATIPYALKLANEGLQQAVRHDAALRKGVNTANGVVTYRVIAEELNLPYEEVEQALGIK